MGPEKVSTRELKQEGKKPEKNCLFPTTIYVSNWYMTHSHSILHKLQTYYVKYKLCML